MYKMAWNAFKRVWHFLTRLNVAALFLLIVLLLASLGSCFPQSPTPVASDPGRLARWEADIQARYGPLAAWLAVGSAFRWFHSPLFLAPLALLAVATLVCTLDRWGGVWRRVFQPPGIDSVRLAFEAAPHSARLTGLPAAGLPHAVRQRLEERGFRVRSLSAAEAVYLRGERYRLAPLGTLGTHLGLLLLLLGATLSRVYGWQEELTLEPGAMAKIGHGSQLALRNEGLQIVRYPDGSVAAYQARVAVFKGDQPVQGGELQVNRPLAYRGLGLYLRGYAERQGRYSLTVWAVRDPGYSLVITAGFLLLLGLTLTFNFPRAWIQAWIKPGGDLQLAGWAERQAFDFEREFAALVEEMEDQKGDGMDGWNEKRRIRAESAKTDPN